MAYKVDPDLIADLSALKRALNALADKAFEEGLELHIEIVPIETADGVINSFAPYLGRKIYAPEDEAPDLTVVPT